MVEQKDGSDFVTTLGMLRSGAALPEIDQALAELIGAVKATGKAGSITVTLSVSPANKGANNMFFVTDQVAVKPPKVDREQTLVYATDDNTLSRRDPRQPELPGVSREPAELRSFPREAQSGGE
jgi:hypothetical protein